MGKVSTPSRFIVQSDWDVSIRTKGDSFWAGLKEPGKESVYCKFFPDSNDETKILSSDPRFEAVFKTDKRSLFINGGQSRPNGTEFVAPLKIGGSIHQKGIYSLDVSTGGLGVSSDSDGGIFVWETESFEKRRALVGHYGDTYVCKFFPSGLVVLSGGADMQLKIWSVETGECARTLIGHRQAITDVGFIDRGRNILSCSKDGTCHLWDCGSNAALATFKPECGQINSLAIGTRPNSSEASSESSDDRESGTENKLLSVGCENGAVFVYGIGDRTKVFSVTCDSSVNASLFNSEGTVLICGTDKGSICAVDIRKSNSFLYTIQEDRGSISSICKDSDGFWASFADGSVCYRSFQLEDNNTFSRFELSGSDCDPINRVCTDGSYLYTCCRDAKIRKYSVSTA